MEKEIIFLVEEDAGGGYTASALGHDIFTEADTLKELKADIKEAVCCHFEESEKPPVIRFIKNYLYLTNSSCIPFNPSAPGVICNH